MGSGTDKLAVCVAFLLAASFTKFSVSGDLVSQVHLNEFLLLHLFVHYFLDLVQGFFWSEMRLVVKAFNSCFSFFLHGLLDDLVLQKVTVLSVLRDSILML